MDGARMLALAAGRCEFAHGRLYEGNEVDLGGLTLRALATPGHTDGQLWFELVDRVHGGWRVQRQIVASSAAPHADPVAVPLAASPDDARDEIHGLSSDLDRPRTVTGIVDDLAAAGLLQRVPHPTDRRAFLVTLTDDGRRLVETLRAERQALAMQLCAGLDGPDLEAAATVVDLVAGRLAAATAHPSEAVAS